MKSSQNNYILNYDQLDEISLGRNCGIMKMQ